MNYLKKLLALILLFIPRRLPVGMDQFEAFAARIMTNVGPGLEKVPASDIKFVLATTITHMGPQVDKKPDIHFIRTLRAAAAKQIAGGVFSQVKEEQRKRQEEMQRAAEATVVVETTNGQKN